MYVSSRYACMRIHTVDSPPRTLHNHQTCLRAYINIPAYIHTHTATQVHAYLYAYIPAYTHIHTFISPYIHTYIHTTKIPTYQRTYIHT